MEDPERLIFSNPEELQMPRSGLVCPISSNTINLFIVLLSERASI